SRCRWRRRRRRDRRLLGEQPFHGRCLPPLLHVLPPHEIVWGKLARGRQFFKLRCRDRAVLLAALCVVPVCCHVCSSFVLLGRDTPQPSSDFNAAIRSSRVESWYWIGSFASALAFDRNCEMPL